MDFSYASNAGNSIASGKGGGFFPNLRVKQRDSSNNVYPGAQGNNVGGLYFKINKQTTVLPTLNESSLSQDDISHYHT